MTLELLLQKAFRSVPAREANAAIFAMRAELAVGGQDALNYEMVADVGTSLEVLSDRALGKLVYFLDCRGLPLHATTGIFISLFAGETLYFLHASDVVDALRGERTYDALIARFGANAADGEKEKAPADGSGARELKLLPKA